MSRPPRWLRCLAAIVARPGQLDARALAALLEAPPEQGLGPRAAAPPSPAALARCARLGLAPPRALSAQGEAQARARQAADLAAWRRRAVPAVRRALWELARRGLVIAADRCYLTREGHRAVGEHGAEGALLRRRYIEDDAGRIVGVRPSPPPPRFEVAVLEQLARGALRPCELRAAAGGSTPRGSERGDYRRALDRLTAEGLLAPPAYRWPTPAGVRAVQAAQASGRLPKNTAFRSTLPTAGGPDTAFRSTQPTGATTGVA